MQMFVWTNPRPNVTHVDSGPAAGDYPTSGAAFGPTFATTGPRTGTVVQALDGGASSTDGCEPITNDLTGAISIVDRGTCNFTVKVANSQAAGAIAVLVVNNVPGAAATLGGADPTILIPSGMVSLDDGTLIKDNLPLTATISADPALAVNRDSDLDAGVIAHEYGHGISNRLTGGPNVTSCLGNAEQMGEGWSDWQALILTSNSDDRVNTARGIGPYVVFQPGDGAGIRPTPYSTDMTVNPSTYLTINNPAISQPHGIGYVWTTMLWEMHWNLVDRYGFNPDVYDPWYKGGNNLAHQLVTDGMKFQPCRPGFEDGRDAILAAERALTLGINKCELWRAFAKRGMGFGADQGSNTDRFDGTESFALPPECTAATFGGFQPPVNDAPSLNLVNAGSTVPLKFTLNGAPFLFVIDSQPVDCATLIPTAEAPQIILPIGISKSGNKYNIKWKTFGSWEDSCRRLTLRVPAATDPVAYFRFH
jgi:hypothetical protein